ncbi:MAG TPA: MFS transporter [Longimicrobiaceae bacterium]|nr:MFS transporter [Longimicrobiaceae bacterium]
MPRQLAAIRPQLFPNPSYYGWVIVGVGFLCSALTSPGQSFVIALYLEPVMADLDVTRVEISSLYAAATLLAAACLPIVGRIADRAPSGIFLGVVVALLGLALAGFSAVSTVAGLAVSFFFLRLLGQGAVGLGTITATVQWFRRYRGRALALVGLGYAFGQLVYPGMIYGLVDRLGWRGSLLALALVYLFVAAPLVGRLIRERRPEDDPVDGARLGHRRHHHLIGEQAETSFALREALRTPVFWGLLVWVAMLPLVHTAVIFHQVALFSSRGWDAALVPPAFMAYALGGVVMTYLMGLLLERRPTRIGLALSLGLSAVALAAIALPLPPFSGALLYGSLLGIASGAHAATSSILWPDYFGIEALGAGKGVVGAAVSGATAIGPPVAAVLVATSGSFDTSLLLFGSICAVGALMSLRLHKPVLEPDRAKSTEASAA